MDMMEQLSRIGIVPVIAINDAADAVPLAQALIDGGLPCAEVTFRTAAAADAIKNMTEAFPDMVVCPGTANPSDIEVALSLGLKTVKFFPAEAAGGLKYIKSIAAPYVDMKFMPTGGVNEKNLLDYLSFNKIICCGGSWMVPGDAVKAKDWDRIRALTSSAVQLMLGLEIAHVGINSADEAEAMDTATKLCKLLGWTMKVGNSSIFAGTGIEVMKTPFRGTKGHIGIKTNFIVRAKAYLERQGFEFDESSANVKDGQLKAIYLKDEIAGFAIHLVQK